MVIDQTCLISSFSSKEVIRIAFLSDHSRFACFYLHFRPCGVLGQHTNIQANTSIFEVLLLLMQSLQQVTLQGLWDHSTNTIGNQTFLFTELNSH